ncbi:hypothetical protein EV646_10687 [Kribbella antiqua]|uniref:Uncharacterized protein n=1 Tax=Kribbella antiqua TaxID=2512217 RepID=A0A4R2IRY7_9ACTN|nr:hypothetical protein EV646_10687 [Kribbella antiqua]
MTLLQGLNRIVIAEFGADRSSVVPDDQLDRPVTLTNQRYLESLANNGGLQPGASQAQVWAALTEAVAVYADRMAAGGPRPETPGENEPSKRPEDRQTFEVALSRLHARSATPRLVQRGFPPDWVTALGEFPPPVLYPDQLTASTIVAEITEQTERDDEAEVLTELIAAGYGARGATAAHMLLASAPGYSTLPEDLQEEVVQDVARELEGGFASPTGYVPETHPELAGDVTNDPVLRGKVAVAWANHIAAERIEEHHDDLRQEEKAAVLRMTANQRPARSRPAQPESVHDVIRGIDAELRELIGAEQTMWRGEIGDYGLKRDQRISSGHTMFRVRPDDALLSRLTSSDAGGRLDPEEVAGLQQAIKQTVVICAKWAHPNAYNLQQHVWATAFDPRFRAMERAVVSALADNEHNTIVDRRFPPALADQLRTPEPPGVFDQPLRTPAPPSADEEYAPAAQGFAEAVYGDEPEALIRRMAREGLPDMGMAAGEVLVAGSAISPEDRQAAAWVLGEKINDGFDALPARLEEWKSTSVLPAAALSREYGEELGRMAERLVHDYARDPDLLQQDVAAAEAKTAAAIEAQRGSMPEIYLHDRLLPGMDRAQLRPRPTAPSTAPAVTRTSAPGQSGPSGLAR